MLRLLVLILLLANAAFFGWKQGLLQPWGMGPVQQAEPHRLGQQIRPEAVRVLRPGEGASSSSDTAISGGPGAARVAECLASGPLDEARATAVRQVLAGWPAGGWSLEPASQAGRWIVYMGKYATPESVERKKAELRQRGVSFESVGNPALEPGLSLGGFASPEAARQHLDALAARGVRTATVVQERAQRQGHALRLTAVDEALQARLQPLRLALGPEPLRPCR